MAILKRLFGAPSRRDSTARATPAGARCYAIGDIHGRSDLLTALLQRIRDDLAAAPVERAFAVFLGDYIDRGHDSAGVLETLSTLSIPGCRSVFLAGNHEEIMLRVLKGEPAVIDDWLRFGGAECLASYGLDPERVAFQSETDAAAELRRVIPRSHQEFLTGLGDSFRFGDYLFVHAGIRPGVAIEAQDPADLRWIRGTFLNDSKDHGALVVHGHTISEGVDERPNRVGIDTGAYRTGVLTALVADADGHRFLATG